jgi:hypothetical protein
MFVDPRTGTVVNDGAHVQNGQFAGPAADAFAVDGMSWQPGINRPYVETNPNSPSRGKRCVTLATGRMVSNAKGQAVPEYRKYLIEDLQRRGINSPVWNALLLPKDAWIRLDAAVTRPSRQRLNAWEDLAAASSVGGFDAWSTWTFEYQGISDPGEARVDMDPVVPGRTDRPRFDLRSLPLPVTHSDFFYTKREIDTSRRSGQPLDTTMGESCTRRVEEVVEQTTIGTTTGVTYGPSATSDARYVGTSTVYGYTNSPYRITKTDLNVPTAANPEKAVEDVLEMLELMYAQGFFGPFTLYHSTGYSRFYNDDYFRTGGTAAVRTTRERLMNIENISAIKRLDYLTSGYQLVLVQLGNPATAQAINGMPPTLLQWETSGGLMLNFKVMAIQVPLIRGNFAGVTAIVHGTTA